jgi:hypothetical protein
MSARFKMPADGNTAAPFQSKTPECAGPNVLNTYTHSNVRSHRTSALSAAAELVALLSQYGVTMGDESGNLQPPMVETDIVGPARDQLVNAAAGPFAHGLPCTTRTEAIFRGLAQLKPRTLAVMHGAAFRGDGARALTDLDTVIADLAHQNLL